MSCCSLKCRKCTTCSLIVLGIPLLIVGIVVLFLGSFTNLAEDKIKENLPVKPGSKSYEKWEEPDDRLREFYIFNITNTNVQDGRFPEVKRLGPYAYRQIISNNVTNTQDDTITYVPHVQYVFDKAKSCKNCNPSKDQIMMINYPLLILTRLAAHGIRGNKRTAAIIDNALKRSGIALFQMRSVHGLLWGYKDPTFAAVALKVLNASVPQVYALQVNNSGSGSAKIYTGEDNVDRVAEYVEWRGHRKLPWWSSVTANMINGTDGARFAPSIDKDDELYLLVTEICRSVKVTYDSTVDFKGIDLYRFTLPKEAFESGDINANNKGFCVTGLQKKCLPSGLQDINPCKGGLRKGPPIVASFPNFYFGNPLLSKIFKMNPVKTQDETYIDIEPNTGLSMRFHKRVQVNMVVSNFSIINMLLNIGTSRPVFFPVFYLDESAEISDEDADDFKKKVLLPLRAIKAVPYVMIGLGALFVLITVVMAILLCKKKEETSFGVRLQKR